MHLVDQDVVVMYTLVKFFKGEGFQDYEGFEGWQF